MADCSPDPSRGRPTPAPRVAGDVAIVYLRRDAQQLGIIPAVVLHHLRLSQGDGRPVSPHALAGALGMGFTEAYRALEVLHAHGLIEPAPEFLG